MRKHRRKTHYRKIAIAAIALGAVGVPSAAMACMDPQESQDARSGGKPWGQWKNASADQRWGGGERDGKWKQERGGSKPSAPASEAPSAAPSAPSTPSASEPTAPKPATSKPAASKPAAPSTTAPKPTTPAAPASGAVARIVELVNSERSKAGCSPVTLNATLSKAAQAHSEDMASHKNMSHTGSDGSAPGDRITRAGYSWSTYGENVAYGYDTPESVMAGWMDSPGHRENILNCEFKEIGVGLAQPNNYWTQDFGTAR
ncbi:CAP domain-containing protein [Streptomyces sp. NPDC007861]|uniref:CAP domain-containing protein n=1 Tax=Streptomyces sp. NPDC007861 TaxID=3154893 RepID=UPI003404B930